MKKKSFVKVSPVEHMRNKMRKALRSKQNTVKGYIKPNILKAFREDVAPKKSFLSKVFNSAE